MGKYFGTDGFRGEANVNLTVEHAYQVGRYLGWYFGQDHKARVVIGKDTRRSSYMFEYSLVAGLTASGADVYLLHVTTTPSVSYVVRTENFDCGIMISASHNPFHDNGIKVINSAGHKMEADVEEADLTAHAKEASLEEAIASEDEFLEDEDLNTEQNRNEDEKFEQSAVFFWTPNGKSYHADQNCTYLKRSKTIISGTEQEAKEAGKTTVCSVCSTTK